LTLWNPGGFAKYYVDLDRDFHDRFNTSQQETVVITTASRLISKSNVPGSAIAVVIATIVLALYFLPFRVASVVLVALGVVYLLGWMLATAPASEFKEEDQW
jgi:hypothetical protein